MSRLRVATRQSPLALVQAELAAQYLRAQFGADVELHKVVTTGDRQAAWSLEAKGGKGLFTAELEEALRRGEADVAVHSTKDLPGANSPGLVIAGYLPRANPRDVLVYRLDRESALGTTTCTVATSSPRRRLQAAMLFPAVQFCEIRGNVDTRLKKIARGEADATVLAAAGLERLGITDWAGLGFRELPFTAMVPAVGQGAIALQCRASDGGKFGAGLDAATGRAVALERAVQTLLGGGCHTALGAHVAGDTLYFFYEGAGPRTFPVSPADLDRPEATAAACLRRIGLAPL